MAELTDGMHPSNDYHEAEGSEIPSTSCTMRELQDERLIAVETCCGPFTGTRSWLTRSIAVATVDEHDSTKVIQHCLDQHARTWLFRSAIPRFYSVVLLPTCKDMARSRQRSYYCCRRGTLTLVRSGTRPISTVHPCEVDTEYPGYT